MKTVFISRKIGPSSPLREILSSLDFKLYGESLIEFSALDFLLPSSCDWIFFYSSNGIRYFLEGMRSQNMEFLNGKKLATMGKGSAKTLRSFGLEPDFVGTGKPESTARSFLKKAENQKVLFARASQSAKSIQNLLSPYINIIDLAVYKNEIRKDYRPPQTDYVVLTSSMSVDAFFDQLEEKNRTQYIAIGKPTALRYAGRITKKVFIPNQPSEESIARLILELEKKNEHKDEK